MEPAELEGVDTERSRCGTASSAIEGDVLGEGESGRCSGEARPFSVSLWLADGLDELTSTTSAILTRAVNNDRLRVSRLVSCVKSR